MNTTNHISPSGEDAANGAMPDTGNAEADQIINRLSSSDPEFDDCIDAVAFIRKLVAEHKGPEGFATWKDAALDERHRRLAAEKRLRDTSKELICAVAEQSVDQVAANGAIGEREFDQWFKTRGVWPRLTYLEVWQASRAALTANVAMGEREAFDAFVRENCDPDRIEDRIARDGEHYVEYATMLAWAAWQARAALTAEKVAGQEPVAWRYLTPTGWHATAKIDKALGASAHHDMEPLYAAPQQPAQSAEQEERAALPEPGFIASAETMSAVSAALGAVRQHTNDRVADQMNLAVNMLLDELGHARAASTATRPAQTQMALMDEQRQKIAEAHDCSLDGDHKAARGILMTLLAAQPVSGGEA